MLNKLWEHDRMIKNHYLYESKSGYFFKYTVKDNYYHFLSAISNIFNISIDDLKAKIINTIKKDKDNMIFNYINNGDLRGAFKTREDFIEYVSNSLYLEYEIVGEILSIPNVLTKNGLFYYVIKKNKKNEYFMKCLNNENIFMIDQNKDIVIILKEEKYYFPVYLLKKEKKVDKKIKLTRYYTKEIQDKYSSVFNELYKYYSQSCQSNILRKINNSYDITAKNIINRLIGSKFQVTQQIIDERFKTRYLLINNNLLLPVTPSGTMFEYTNYF